MDAQMIRRARELTGESQSAFGARFGVDQSTAHRWETEGPPSRGPGRMALTREVQAIFQAHGEQMQGTGTCTGN
jgi:DNA-binding transcriptional regulator YiaG